MDASASASAAMDGHAVPSSGDGDDAAADDGVPAALHALRCCSWPSSSSSSQSLPAAASGRALSAAAAAAAEAAAAVSLSETGAHR